MVFTYVRVSKKTRTPNYNVTWRERAVNSSGPDLDPGLGDIQLFVEANGVPVGHPGDEVLRGHVQPLVGDGPLVQELGRTLAHSLPEAAENAGRLAELGR